MSAVLAPKMDDGSLQQSTNQIVSHIRYTQHLALTDDKFSNTDATWFRKRWQIRFQNDAGGTNNGNWIYSIYSDTNKNNTIDRNEIAKNPENPNKFLTGFYSTINGEVQKSTYTKKMDIEDNFGITDVVLTGGCANSSQISFDRVGRPFMGNPSTQASAYPDSITAPANSALLLTTQCKIAFIGNDDKNITIAIEPETGYVHQL